MAAVRGDTSVKSRASDLLGDEVDVIHIKGSGWDMGNIEPAGLPAVRLALNAFREGLYVVGGRTRATGTLQYPTVASMYLEVVFATAWRIVRRTTAELTRRG